MYRFFSHFVFSSFPETHRRLLKNGRFFSSILLFRIAYEKNLACVGVGKTAKESGVLQCEPIRKEAHSGDEQESGAIRGCVTEQHTLRKNALCQKKDAREDEGCMPNGVCGGSLSRSFGTLDFFLFEVPCSYC